MNVSTIQISKSEALEKLKDYEALNDSQWTREDERLRQLYKAVIKGARVVNVAEAFKATGLNESGQPKLAIARADQKTIWFHPRRNFEQWSHNQTGSGGFSPSSYWKWNCTAQNYVLPRNVFDNEKLTQRLLKSAVPHIPPTIRPQIHLRNFHILFEVQSWEEYPVDPFLMRHIEGRLFVVVAEWELTPLEASLLGSMRTGN